MGKERLHNFEDVPAEEALQQKETAAQGMGLEKREGLKRSKVF